MTKHPADLLHRPHLEETIPVDEFDRIARPLVM
jgi:hypothetical protein